MLKEQIKSVEDLLLYARKNGSPMETKANENVDPTTNANWYSAYGMVSEIKDMTFQRGQLLSQLQEGFEGNNLPDSYPVPYNITNQFMQGKTVWRDEARPSFDNRPMTDAKGTIAPVSFILQIGVNDEMIATSTDKGLYDKLVQMLAKAAVSTVEGCIINGDTETGGTGNVNSDDQAPATTFATEGGAEYHSLKIDHGIRENCVTNSKTYDVSAFDSDDMMTVRALLAGRYNSRASDLLYLFEPSTHLTAMTDDAFKLAYATRNPSVDGSNLQSAFGVTSIVHDLVPKTEADGKVSATPSNNTKGQFLCVFKPAIRWGYGKDVQIEVERVQGYGFELTLTMKFGFVILDLANTCAMGRDVTV